MAKKNMTGLLMARPTYTQSDDGRELVMLFGIVAVPEDLTFKEGHQYVVVGHGSDEGTRAQILMNMDEPIDLSELARGMSPQNLLCDSIWRV